MPYRIHDARVFDDFEEMIQIVDEKTRLVLYANHNANQCFSSVSVCQSFHFKMEDGAYYSFECENIFYNLKLKKIIWKDQICYMEVISKDVVLSNRVNQMIAHALDNDYMSMAIVDIKNETAQVLALNAKRIQSKLQEYSYYEMCNNSIKKYVLKEDVQPIKKAVQLDFVQEQLMKKNEFGFVFNLFLKGEEHSCQVKYIRLEDPNFVFMGFRFVDGLIQDEKQQKIDLQHKLKLAQSEKHLMEALCSDYTAAYYCDLIMDYMEPIQVKDFCHMSKEPIQYSFSKFIQWSYDTFLIHDSCKDYLELFNLENLRNTLKSKNSISYRVKILPNEAGMQYFEIHIVKLFENKDSFRIIVGYRPIDEIVKQEKVSQENLRLALNLAKKANEAKSNFLFNMSHDIRTPMNAILGFNDLISLNKDNVDKVEEYSYKIKQSSLYLLSLIDDILEMSRIESGKLILDENVIHTKEFNDSIAVIFENQMKKKEIEFTRKLNVKSHYLYCDLVKLKEILVNIISNAYKYTLPHGKIHFEVTEIPKDEHTVFFKSVIEDTGIGMSQEFLNHIFDSFSQERTSTESGQQGTGLGMAITKRLVDLMHGTIQVESKLGIGTRITVILPHRLADEKMYSLQNEKVVEVDQDFTGKRVLLVEDNILNTEIATELLERMDLNVEHASNGVECIDLLEKHDAHYYNIILMDILMPEMNGYKATQIIRKMDNKKLATIPIVAMTANAFEQDKQKALSMGMNAHIAKPINMQELKQVLSKYME